MSFGRQTESVKNVDELDPVADFAQGVEMLKNGYPQRALVCLRRAFECQKQNPYYLSFLGLAVARAERKWDQAVELCESALHLKRAEIQFHLNLADVYATAGQRGNALHTLDTALELLGEDKRLRSARIKIEKRRNPILPFLPRENFLNHQLGKLRHALKYSRKKDPVKS